MSTPQAVKLDDETKKRLQDLGELKDRSPHWMMKTAIEEYVTREERYEREKQEDFQRWDRYVMTGEAIPHEKVSKWLGEWAKGKTPAWPE